ncbi:alkaline phosphatase family protein [Paenibacillus apiarius]|uniref:alkaline phosphatase family protein n=1 Tax=Paenibacillus apiarius TaxID=46240 RepID=UPI0019816187|nr:alkaline phosphatase family protein [Paenibacillus apiarius]MBN3527192.1 alkaline phosphatase family protein [Paenibacillus apiarius]
MKRGRWLLIVLLLFVSIVPSACQQGEGKKGAQPRIKRVQPASPSKRVILVILDSVMDKPLHEAIRNGQAPALKFLKERGHYKPDVVSSFPTMSVTIDSTVLTGTGPDRHRIPGLVWYNAEEGRLISYGTAMWETLKLGVGDVFMNSLYRLNNEHLNKQVKTIHEELADKGIETASINGMVYRGTTDHRLKVPAAIADTTTLPRDLKTLAPKYFSLGALSRLKPDDVRNTHAWQSYGLNDEFSADELIYLIEQNRLPPFSLVYFPSNDRDVHKKGPAETRGIEQADRLLQRVFQAFGSWDAAMKDNVWLIAGDSGQTYIERERERSVIDLRQVLNPYRIAALSKPVTKQDQLVLAVNERMAYVYINDAKVSHAEAVRRLQQEKRIDVIAWREGEDIHVRSGRNKHELTYRPKGNVRDRYGQTWNIRGDMGLLGLSMRKSDNRLEYGDYPDGLMRLHSALASHKGNFVIVTAAPGSEFVGESSPTHLGGAGHGSLHKQDSHVPLIISGAESRPDIFRLTDIKRWIMGELGR